ncbi:unnamed protein product [Effrenium voratum]|nr:unnamed protein product [Effrenium voratum]
MAYVCDIPDSKGFDSARVAANLFGDCDKSRCPAFSESVLLQRQTVLKALCSHGGLLCRRRNLEELFPNPGVFPLKTAAEAAAQSELASLIPAPVEEAQEDPPP